ncbi:SMI1/KNR4 family protein [Sphingomonas sp. HF-S3]|uniref:SMI1/KNR4 family protein n=1 Tax=Sphingomonas rustica TaxID=3103142 RepID=A0ABV0B587_9SPHN
MPQQQDDGVAPAIRIFEDRLILEAQPPISDDRIAEIEARVGRPLPPGLVALWRTAFGGRLDYALSIDFNGTVAGFSCNELFYPDSDGYHDLWGWIDHEIELAREAGDPMIAQGQLRYLPFGGFEYLDRLYVCLEEGPDYGAVVAYMQGLPPAWALRLHEDSIARIADDVPGFFHLLGLDQDPFESGDDAYAAGDEMVDAIETVRRTDPARAERLTALVRSAVLDWRAALDDGSIATDARLRRLALNHAASKGDLVLIEGLAALGCDLGERYIGGGNLLDHALLLGQDGLADAMIERGLDASNSIIAAASTIDARRTAQLLDLGAEIGLHSPRTAANAGHVDSARLMVDALARLDLELLEELPDQLNRSADDAHRSAERIESGDMGSNVAPDDYRRRAGDLRDLARHVEQVLADGTPSPSGGPWWRKLIGG